MLIKALKAISKSTAVLAKTFETTDKVAEKTLKKEYLHNLARFAKSITGRVAESAGYVVGKIEDKLDNKDAQETQEDLAE